MECKLAYERHSLIAVVLSFGGPLDRPSHHKIAGNGWGAVILLNAEPVKGFENVCFKIVGVPTRLLLPNQAGNILGERALIFSHVRASAISIPESPIAHSRILCSSVERYSSTLDSFECPSV